MLNESVLLSASATIKRTAMSADLLVPSASGPVINTIPVAETVELVKKVGENCFLSYSLKQSVKKLVLK